MAQKWNLQNALINLLLWSIVLGAMLFFWQPAQAEEALPSVPNDRGYQVDDRPKATVNIITVNTTSDVINNGDGLCSLREAIISANSNPVGLIIAGECAHGSNSQTDQIVLQNGETYNLSINGADEDDAQTGDLDILTNNLPFDSIDVQITTNGKNPAVIDADLIDDRVLHIDQAKVDIQNIHFINGEVITSGGGIRNDEGTLTMSNGLIAFNTGRRGGGIANFDGHVTLTQVEITQNEDTDLGLGGRRGGGIYSNGFFSTLTLQAVSINDNHATDNGGGIYNVNGAIIFEEGSTPNLINLNSTDGDGGGIYNTNGKVSGNSVQLQDNSAQGTGAGIFNTIGSMDLTAVEVTQHSAKPAIVNQGVLRLTQSDIFENGSTGLRTEGGQTTLEQTSVRNNGRGLHITSQASMTVTQSSIVSNTSTSGAGIYIFDSNLLMANSTVSSNKTTLGHGAGLHVQGNSETVQVQLINVTMSHNESNAGSTIFAQTGSIFPTVINSILAAPAGESVCVTSHDTPPLVSLGHNLVSDDTCFAANQASDLINVDPQLNSVKSHEETFVHFITPASPAYGVADTTACANPPVNGVDQRNQSRSGANCDIGAVESALLIVEEGEEEEDDEYIIYLPAMFQ